MTAKYFAILTNQGAARLANAAALGTKLNLTQMAVGDANGTLPTPDPAQTKLINQKRIAPLNLLTVDPANTSQIIAEQIIPENEGGFWIREIGLYDDDGILIAVANCPETYKPQLQEGSGRTQTIRMILIVSSTSAITLKIDPAVVLATRQYVDDKIIEVKGYADDLMKKHVEAANPHKQYPLIANALKEMVDAGLAGDVLKNLGLGEAAKRNVGNGENQIPDMSFWTVTGGNGNFVIRQPDGLIIQMVTVSISGPVAMNGMTDNAYAITGSNKSYIATATLPFVFPNKVLGVIPLVSTTAYGGVSSNITGSYATAVCSFAAVRGNNTIVFKVDKPLNAAFPSDTSVSALIIGR
ncbi:phage tail protein [Escherichia coli]|nr:phage tail protein [Escherichia coli]EFJ3001360.1 phage tail protein [Escherichia coli]EFN1835293.1 phage tail protein [Escherichia coli]